MNELFNKLGNLLRRPKVTSITGMLFQVHGQKATTELWDSTKRETIKYIDSHYYYFIHEMPCKNVLKFKSPEEIMDLPIKDIPCPCGDKTHWLVRFVNSGVDVIGGIK